MIAGLGLIVGGAGAGLFGSLLGLGGGVLIVPMLTLGFGMPLRDAVGVSLVSVIVTSSASASVYLQRHVANLRLGMTLELFTAFGALVGGLLAYLLDERTLAGLFAALLIYVAISMLVRHDPRAGGEGAVADDAETSDDEEPPSGGRDATVIGMPPAGRNVTRASHRARWPGRVRSSNRRTMAASTTTVSTIAKERPMQLRGPPLKGKKVYGSGARALGHAGSPPSRGLAGAWRGSKRSGSNSSGRGQWPG